MTEDPGRFAEGVTEERWRSLLVDLDAANERFAGLVSKSLRDHYDVVVIGSGPGGGTLAWALRDAGNSVLLVERGGFLPLEPTNWNSPVVLGEQRYANSEEWLDAAGRPFQPHMYYYVGGMTKLYAGTLLRLRSEDFRELHHADGSSPAWPIGYEEFEPWYARAEQLYLAHGASGQDPTEPWRSAPFPHPPLQPPPEIQELFGRLSDVGLHPFLLPQGMALGDGGRCIYCAFCDSHPCRVLAKAEPELCCIRPALESDGVTLLADAKVERLLTSSDGRTVIAMEANRHGEVLRIGAHLFVVSCGAVNTPALLLRSASPAHPTGLANTSGLVGANYMRHVSTMMLAQHPRRVPLPQNHYWKTLGINDYYLSGDGDWPYPLGVAQVTGNYHEQMAAFLPEDAAELATNDALVQQLVPIFVLTEDLPRERNRVTVTADGAIQVSYEPTNVSSHQRLLGVLRAKLPAAGFGRIFARSFLDVTEGGGYHHCGTARFGHDPATSVLDANCRAHDVDNLYVVDACFFPSSGAVNPVLTIAANALRVAAHLRAEVLR